jgi:outer membrane protein TolC
MRMMNYIKTLSGIVICLMIQQVYSQQLLTKKEAIEITLENNYGIKLATNNLEIAKNNSSIYNSRYLPTITVNGGANYNVNDLEAVDHDGNRNTIEGAETKTYNASVNLNYILFDGLGRKYDYKQLKELYQLSELQARETIENTYLQLFNVYFQIARLTENTQNLRRTLDISKQRLQRARYQYEYGQATKLEMLNAEVDVNNDSIILLNANQLLINTKRDLNIIMGGQQKTDFEVETSVDFIALESFDKMLSKAKENNVLLNQIEKDILISEYNIRANKGDYLPSVGLNGSYGWNKSENPSTSLFSEFVNNGWSAGINLSWNVFDGGSTKTRVANSRIALDNQEILKEQEIETLENRLLNAFEEYKNKLFILSVQEKNVITNQNNFDRTQERYVLGQVTSIEFRQAQINLLRTQTSLNNAKYDAKLIELELLQLTGQLLDIDF